MTSTQKLYIPPYRLLLLFILFCSEMKIGRIHNEAEYHQFSLWFALSRKYCPSHFLPITAFICVSMLYKRYGKFHSQNGAVTFTQKRSILFYNENCTEIINERFIFSTFHKWLYIYLCFSICTYFPLISKRSSSFHWLIELLQAAQDHMIPYFLGKWRLSFLYT